ncbi:MAG: response regulator [Cyclobacteriaceae bacterium]|nr:response regulator [Cyclobacteriaceae bacterium]
MQVLYAEDDLEDLETFCEVLSKIDASARCVHARNGLDVLEILETTSELPDYIFLDINMPVMDGRACLREIKKDQRFTSIPVVIYTTSNNPQDKALCMELGATAYIIKPNGINEAIKNLSVFFKKDLSV